MSAACLRLRASLAPLAAALLALACGGGHESPPTNVWTWVDVAGAECSDGSQTGIGVNRGTGDTVLVFLDGGGACWDTLTCFTLDAADPGPFGAAQLDARLAHVPGSVLDRTVPGTPFADATLVFVPYCTGDVHLGDATRRYPGAPRDWHHHGKRNVEAALDWLLTALPAPTRVVVSGASAGGFGSLLALDLAAARWPGARSYVVDDSGPPLVKDDFSPLLRAAWYASWRLDDTLGPICPGCSSDLSAIVPALAARHPSLRLGILSSRQDGVIRLYVGLTPAQFEQALVRLDDEVVATTPGAAMFIVPGDTHTMLGHPADFTAGGVALPEWIRRMVTDDPAWATAGR